MAKNEEMDDINVDEEIEEPEELRDENDEDITDWKTLALKHHGIAKRYQTKLKKVKEAEEKAKTEAEEKVKLEGKEQAQDKKEFDLAEESYLIARGIKEFQFGMILEELNSSKLTLKQLLDSPYFKEKLEKAASAEATPEGSKRGGGASQNEVDYWIAKGQYPPNTPENQELRRKVAAELAKQAGTGSKFSPNPIT